MQQRARVTAIASHVCLVVVHPRASSTISRCDRRPPRHRTHELAGRCPTGLMDEPIEIVELPPRRALTVRRKMPQSGLGAFFSELFPRLRTALVEQGATPSGPPFARYYNSDPAAFDTEAGIPFTGTVTNASN